MNTDELYQRVIEEGHTVTHEELMEAVTPEIPKKVERVFFNSYCEGKVENYYGQITEDEFFDLISIYKNGKELKRRLKRYRPPITVESGEVIHKRVFERIQSSENTKLKRLKLSGTRKELSEKIKTLKIGHDFTGHNLERSSRGNH